MAGREPPKRSASERVAAPLAHLRRRNRPLSTPSIPDVIYKSKFSTQDYIDKMEKCKERYLRPRSVSFHPDIRLFYAATTNDLEEVKMLIEGGLTDVSATNPAEGATALHGAAYEGNAECMEYLLGRGADVNAQDDDGWTPLHAAVCGGNMKCVELLLQANSNHFAENTDGFTPFQMSLELKSEPIIHLFVQRISTELENGEETSV